MTHSASVLLTRPLDASRAFAAQLEAATSHPLHITLSPLIRYETSVIAPGDVPAGLPVFTSAQGVRAWMQNALPVHGAALCVGAATTRVARDSGFDAARAGYTVEDVFDVLCKTPPDRPVLHIHGAHTRGNLVQRLNAAGIAARGLKAYDQPLCDLTEEARALLDGKERVIVPLFSPRSAAQFAKVCPKGAKTCVIAMSEAVAQNADVDMIAARPDGPSMLEAVVSCLN